MDKYEFNIKVEQIKKLVSKGDFQTSMKIVDTIDWRHVRNANLLSMVAQVYEKNEEYQEAKEILLMAYERTPISKRLLNKLTELALKEGSIQEAESYYRKFCELAPEDPGQHLLRYMILKEKQAPAEQLIHSLEQYTYTELDEKWLYELAEQYCQAGREDDCVKTCDKIMLMFGLGKYVDKAMELKVQFAPLTSYQRDLVENRDKYEAKLRAVAQKFGNDIEDDGFEEEFAPEMTEEIPEPEEEESFTSEEIPLPQIIEENMVASIHQAETEQELAEEVSKLANGDYLMEDPNQHTKILEDIKNIDTSFVEKTVEVPEPQETVIEDLVDEADAVIVEDLADDMIVHEETVDEELAAEEMAGGDEAEESLTEEAEADNGDIATDKVQKEEAPVLKTEGKTWALHIMIEAKTPEKGLELAIKELKKIHSETGNKNQVIKISGGKLSEKGVANIADKLVGKDMVIEEAGDLEVTAMEDLHNLIVNDETGMAVVLIDNPGQIETIYQKNPDFAGIFKCVESYDAKEPAEEAVIEAALAKEIEIQEKTAREVIQSEEEPPIPVEKTVPQEPVSSEHNEDEEMDIDEFAEYACKYAGAIDCNISGKSMLALYERIEIMEEDGIPLTKINAKEMIEEAADKAEKPSLGKLITGVFSSKYDKEGLLILKEEHFIG